MIQCMAPIISSKPAHTVHVHTVLYTVAQFCTCIFMYIQCMYVVDQVIVYSVRGTQGVSNTKGGTTLRHDCVISSQEFCIDLHVYTFVLCTLYVLYMYVAVCILHTYIHVHVGLQSLL